MLPYGERLAAANIDVTALLWRMERDHARVSIWAQCITSPRTDALREPQCSRCRRRHDGPLMHSHAVRVRRHSRMPCKLC